MKKHFLKSLSMCVQVSRKWILFVAVAFVALSTHAAKELVNGFTWEYTVSGEQATIVNVSQLSGIVEIPSVLGGYPVTKIGDKFLYGRRECDKIIIPDGVVSIGNDAFSAMNGIQFEIPASVKSIGSFAISFATIDKWQITQPVSLGINAFTYSSIAYVETSVDCGSMLAGVGGVVAFKCPRQYAASMIKRLGASKFAGYCDDAPSVEIVSAAVREKEPTVMDVVYKVYSESPTVKVRVLAFQDGVRSLSKVVPVKTLVDGTESSVGDAVAANQEHKISWNVAKDWATDLSKVKFEVLAIEEDLLPLELQTIPATDTHPKMKISWNRTLSRGVFDALIWLYADGDSGLTLVNGQLKNGSTVLASGTGLSNARAAVAYVFDKMGYEVLSGEDLTYARRVTQLDLPVDGAQQFAVKKYE